MKSWDSSTSGVVPFMPASAPAVPPLPAAVVDAPAASVVAVAAAVVGASVAGAPVVSLLLPLSLPHAAASNERPANSAATWRTVVLAMDVLLPLRVGHLSGAGRRQAKGSRR